MARSRPRTLSPARAARLRPLLDRLDAAVDRAARVSADPVEFPRAFPDPDDAEVAALVAVSLAYGRADVFKPVVARVLAAMSPSPARFVEVFARAPAPGAFEGVVYRFNRPPDLAALAAGAGAMRLRHGGLGARFTALFREAGGGPAALRPALAAFAAELRDAPVARGLLAGRGPRGLRHLLPDPAGPGASKRWNLYLRWMIRGPDAVDLGLWRGVPASALVVPLDTHVHRVARALGLTARRDASWRTAEEITAALRRVDPEDPVRYDFALCHLGMSGACPARRDRARCAACVLAPACAGGAPPRASDAPRGRSTPAGTAVRGGPGRRRGAARRGARSARGRTSSPARAPSSR
ncbi:TIGR02757 family protein [Anaeromyxobacter oryzisoli]|uniref:TIGR02757 family protein n=1 Tax=Anaeromyxobacter oryzisoli TaxID=2925408 RepID=UPI001F57D75C|nr:TIGR02757 family protein [Anaeromyxobacter sp. SG63]